MNWENDKPKPENKLPPDWEAVARKLEAIYGRIADSTPGTPPSPRNHIKHRTPSPTTAYESLDHFLFLPDLHWNGRTIPDA